MCQIKNYDVRGLIFGNLGVKKKCFWHGKCYSLLVTRTDSMVSYIGHFDFLSVLPVGLIVFRNSGSNKAFTDFFINIAKKKKDLFLEKLCQITLKISKEGNSTILLLLIQELGLSFLNHFHTFYLTNTNI